MATTFPVTDLARALGVSKSHASRMHAGLRFGGQDLIQKLAQRAGCTTDAVFGAREQAKGGDLTAWRQLLEDALPVGALPEVNGECADGPR